MTDEGTPWPPPPGSPPPDAARRAGDENGKPQGPDDHTPEAPSADLEVPWQRLDRRMLLVHPVQEILRFLPVLLVILLAGSTTGSRGPWELIGVAIPIVIGLLQYYTTRFRITHGRVELRRGLVNRRLLTVQLDRVRAVDLTASPIHRVLGLSRVRIGTGTQESPTQQSGLSLDSLPSERARALRGELLGAAGRRHQEASPENAPPEEHDRGRTVLTFDPRWLRYAPLTSQGLVVAAALAAVLAQTAGAIEIELPGRSAAPDGPGLGTGAVVAVAVLAVVVLLAVVALFSVVGYLVSNGGFRLTHTPEDGSWHVHRGLLTTYDTSLDEHRLAGATVSEPLGIRLAGAARLTAVVTGLNPQQQRSSLLVPAAPRSVVSGVVDQVVPGWPEQVPLTAHGPGARRRRHVRAQLPLAVLTATVAALVVGPAWSPWLLLPAALLHVLAVPLARDRYRALGHGYARGLLAVRSGSLHRRRTALQREHVIGWNQRATWFQRRAGLSTLSATTAGGAQAYPALDIPDAAGVALAGAVTPELLAPFLSRAGDADAPHTG